MNQFRIGGVYRALDGEVHRLEAFLFSQMRGREVARAIPVSEGTNWTEHAGARFLDDGKYPHAGEKEYCGNLIPGELHQVNGEWVPIPSKLSSLSLPNAAEQDEIDAAKCQPAHVSHVEPERAPLDWNKPTPFDSFGPEWKVYSDAVSSGFMGTSKAAPLHPLQRMTDQADALHGSAFLRG